jgi:TonB-linked SusC/RagA family outer membrane protein
MLMLGILVLSAQLLAQNRTITGRVTDAQGNGVPNASVTVKGARTGTTTDNNGNFTLNVADNARTLVVSSVGFTSQEVSVGSGNAVQVSLSNADQALQEVVVTGYTTTARSKSPIASSVVGAKDIENVPMTNVNDILQGKASGLTVMSTTGQPGGSSNVRVRGVGSISAGASPIYVVDGVIVERGQFFEGFGGFTQNGDILSNLNPNDIESVTVLKDAAALALYGSRGGNGVVVITTKKGRAGASRINFSAQYGTTKPSLGNWEMMNAQEVFDYEKVMLTNSGYSQAFINSYLTPDLLDKTFDWVDAAFVDGNIQSYDVSVSGGNDKTRQFFSVGYYDQQGTVLNSGFKRITANLNLDHQVTSRFKVNTAFNTSFSNTLNGDGGGYFSSPILGTLTNSPLWLYPYKEDGSLFVGYEDEFSKNSGNNVAGDNFLYSAERNYNRAKQFRGIGKLTAEYKVANWLNLKQNGAIDIIYAREKNFFDPTTGNGINAADPSKSGTVYEGVNTPITFTSQTSAAGNLNVVNDRHELGYLALMEYQRFQNSNFYAQGDGIADGRLQQLSVTGTPQYVSGGVSEYAFLGYLGQLNYTLDGKYSLTGSVRRDGSSRFGSENRFATFWSVGGSWKAINEEFLQGQRIFSDLRLRASYGTSGVADFGNYLARQLYAYGQSYNGSPGSAPSTPGNPELTWEKNKQLDLGLEFAVLNNRVRGTFDWFRRISSDLLQNAPISRTSGFTSVQKNIGELENKGFEVTINSTNVNGKKFNWTTDFNISHTRNEVLALYNNADIPGGTLARTRVGEPLGSWFLPVWAGVNPDNGDPLWYLADGKTTTNNYATASQLANRKFVGSALPDYTVGLGNTFNYSGLSFSFFFYGNFGSDVYNQTMSFIDSDGLRYGWNYSKTSNENYWTTPGQAADRPKPLVNGNKNSNSASTRWIESNDYIRLRNVTLSYQLPKNLISRAKMNGARLFVTGTNLLTFTDYTGVDPEVSLGGNDVFKYPVNKSLTFGIDITL